MAKQKCDDCITKGVSWGQIVSVAIPLFGVVGFQAVEMYKNSEDRTMTKQIAKSLNNTNRELQNKGIIKDPLFVNVNDSIKDNYDTFSIVDNTIYPKPKEEPKRACTKLSTSEKNFKD